MFLTSNLILCIIDGFTSGVKSQSIAYIPIESVHIYWILTFNVNCTQYGICSQAASKNARARFFFTVGGAGNNFWSGSKQIREVPPHEYDTPESLCGGVQCPLYKGHFSHKTKTP